MKRINKVKAWWNVFNSLVIVGILTLLTKVLYPLAYILRVPIREYANNIWLKFILFPLWPIVMFLYLLLDDSGDFGNEEECWKNIGVYPTNWYKKFIVAYYWSAIRNPVWNSYKYKFFKGVDDSPRSEYYFEKSNVYTYDPENLHVSNNNKVSPDVENYKTSVMNRAKFYYKNSDGTNSPSTNAGDYIDLQASLFGNSIFYFKQNGKWWPLITYCEIKELEVYKTLGIFEFLTSLFTGKNVDEKYTYKIREFNLGAASRILIRNKWQKAKIEKK